MAESPGETRLEDEKELLSSWTVVHRDGHTDSSREPSPVDRQVDCGSDIEILHEGDSVTDDLDVPEGARASSDVEVLESCDSEAIPFDEEYMLTEEELQLLYCFVGQTPLATSERKAGDEQVKENGPPQEVAAEDKSEHNVAIEEVAAEDQVKHNVAIKEVAAEDQVQHNVAVEVAAEDQIKLNVAVEEVVAEDHNETVEEVAIEDQANNNVAVEVAAEYQDDQNVADEEEADENEELTESPDDPADDDDESDDDDDDDDEDETDEDSDGNYEYDTVDYMPNDLEIPHNQVIEDTIRQYSHVRNRRLNVQLNVLVCVTMLLVVGFGLGHYIGWSSHGNNCKTYINKIEQELKRCHADDRRTAAEYQRKIDELFFDNERLKHELIAIKREGLDSQQQREDLNILQNENADLRETVAKLRYMAIRPEGKSEELRDFYVSPMSEFIRQKMGVEKRQLMDYVRKNLRRRNHEPVELDPEEVEELQQYIRRTLKTTFKLSNTNTIPKPDHEDADRISVDNHLDVDRLAIERVDERQNVGNIPIETVDEHQNVDSIPIETVEDHQNVDSIPIETVEKHQNVDSIPIETVEEHQNVGNIPIETVDEHQNVDNNPIETVDEHVDVDRIRIETVDNHLDVDRMAKEIVDDHVNVDRMSIDTIDEHMDVDHNPKETVNEHLGKYRAAPVKQAEEQTKNGLKAPKETTTLWETYEEAVSEERQGHVKQLSEHTATVVEKRKTWQKKKSPSKYKKESNSQEELQERQRTADSETHYNIPKFQKINGEKRFEKKKNVENRHDERQWKKKQHRFNEKWEKRRTIITTSEKEQGEDLKPEFVIGPQLPVEGPRQPAKNLETRQTHEQIATVEHEETFIGPLNKQKKGRRNSGYDGTGKQRRKKNKWTKEGFKHDKEDESEMKKLIRVLQEQVKMQQEKLNQVMTLLKENMEKEETVAKTLTDTLSSVGSLIGNLTNSSISHADNIAESTKEMFLNFQSMYEDMSVPEDVKKKLVDAKEQLQEGLVNVGTQVRDFVKNTKPEDIPKKVGYAFKNTVGSVTKFGKTMLKKAQNPATEAVKNVVSYVEQWKESLEKQWIKVQETFERPAEKPDNFENDYDSGFEEDLNDAGQDLQKMNTWEGVFVDPNNDTVDGDWILKRSPVENDKEKNSDWVFKRGEHRQKQREEERRSDWMFERAQGRKIARNDDDEEDVEVTGSEQESGRYVGDYGRSEYNRYEEKKKKKDEKKSKKFQDFKRMRGQYIEDHDDDDDDEEEDDDDGEEAYEKYTSPYHREMRQSSNSRRSKKTQGQRGYYHHQTEEDDDEDQHRYYSTSLDDWFYPDVYFQKVQDILEAVLGVPN